MDRKTFRGCLPKIGPLAFLLDSACGGKCQPWSIKHIISLYNTIYAYIYNYIIYIYIKILKRRAMSASQRHSQRLFASPFFLHGPLRTGMQMLHSATRDDASWWAFCLFSSGLRQGRRAPDIFPTQG